MPCPLIKGFVDFLASRLPLTVWDGEVPRQNTDGKNINPDSPEPSWPVLRIKMSEGGMNREENFEDSYSDTGPLTIQVWATRRDDLEDTRSQYGLLSQIEQLLVDSGNWPQIVFPSPSVDPYTVYDLQLGSWTCVQEEGVRTQDSQLLYRGEIVITNLGIHGAVATR